MTPRANNHNHSSSSCVLTTVMMMQDLQETHDQEQRNATTRRRSPTTTTSPNIMEMWGSFPFQTTMLGAPLQTRSNRDNNEEGRRAFLHDGSSLLWGPSSTATYNVSTTVARGGPHLQEQPQQCWRLSLLQVIDSALEVLEFVEQDESSLSNNEEEDEDGNNNDQEASS